eukprot:XP_001691078.1 predicted protein [Chlamydomonas reinhardtii]
MEVCLLVKRCFVLGAGPARPAVARGDSVTAKLVFLEAGLRNEQRRMKIVLDIQDDEAKRREAAVKAVQDRNAAVAEALVLHTDVRAAERRTSDGTASMAESSLAALAASSAYSVAASAGGAGGGKEFSLLQKDDPEMRRKMAEQRKRMLEYAKGVNVVKGAPPPKPLNLPEIRSKVAANWKDKNDNSNSDDEGDDSPEAREAKLAAAQPPPAEWRVRMHQARRRTILVVSAMSKWQLAMAQRPGPKRLPRVSSFSYYIPKVLGEEAPRFIEEAKAVAKIQADAAAKHEREQQRQRAQQDPGHDRESLSGLGGALAGMGGRELLKSNSGKSASSLPELHGHQSDAEGSGVARRGSRNNTPTLPAIGSRLSLTDGELPPPNAPTAPRLPRSMLDRANGSTRTGRRHDAGTGGGGGLTTMGTRRLALLSDAGNTSGGSEDSGMSARANMSPSRLGPLKISTGAGYRGRSLEGGSLERGGDLAGGGVSGVTPALSSPRISGLAPAEGSSMSGAAAAPQAASASSGGGGGGGPWAEAQQWAPPTVLPSGEQVNALRLLKQGGIAVHIDACADAVPLADGSSMDVWTSCPWQLVQALRPGSLPMSERLEGVPLGARVLQQLVLAVEALAGKEAVARLQVILAINDDQRNAVVADIIRSRSYGLKPENLILTAQRKRCGYRYDREAQAFLEDPASPAAVLGSGYSLCQLAWLGDAFFVSKDGELSMIMGKTLLERFAGGDKDQSKVEWLVWRRARDLSLLSPEGIMDLPQLAYSLYAADLSSPVMVEALAGVRKRCGHDGWVGLQRYLLHVPTLHQMLNSLGIFRPKLTMNGDVARLSLDAADITADPRLGCVAEVDDLIPLLLAQDRSAAFRDIRILVYVAANDVTQLAVNLVLLMARPGRDVVHLVTVVHSSLQLAAGQQLVLRFLKQLSNAMIETHVEVLVKGINGLLEVMEGAASKLAPNLVVMASAALTMTNLNTASVMGSVTLSVLKRLTLPLAVVTSNSRHLVLTQRRTALRTMAVVESTARPTLVFLCANCMEPMRGDKLVLAAHHPTRQMTTQQQQTQRRLLENFADIASSHRFHSAYRMQLDGPLEKAVAAAVEEEPVHLVGLQVPAGTKGVPGHVLGLIRACRGGVLVYRDTM